MGLARKKTHYRNLAQKMPQTKRQIKVYYRTYNLYILKKLIDKALRIFMLFSQIYFSEKQKLQLL